MTSDRRIQKGLAENLARLAHGGDRFVPVNLEELATSLGVTSITNTKMVEDGRTTWIDGKPRIELRSDRPASRIRFTLAHEIAHVLVEKDQTVARRTQNLNHDDVETLCDWVAASILMPRSWIQRYAEKPEYNLSLIRLVAHRAEVSLSAAAVRIAEVGGRTCMLLRLQRAPKRWLIVGHAAVPRQFVGALAPTPETSDLLDQLANRRDSWREITLQASGTSLKARAHLDRSGKTCLALVTSFSETS